MGEGGDGGVSGARSGVAGGEGEGVGVAMDLLRGLPLLLGKTPRIIFGIESKLRARGDDLSVSDCAPRPRGVPSEPERVPLTPPTLPTASLPRRCGERASVTLRETRPFGCQKGAREEDAARHEPRSKAYFTRPTPAQRAFPLAASLNILTKVLTLLWRGVLVPDSCVAFCVGGAKFIIRI